MNAPRGAALLVAGLLIATAPDATLAAAPPPAGSPSVSSAPVEADAHELYEHARARLEAGHLDEAAAFLQRLQALLAARPEWDPDGTFAKDLVPPLQARLNRLVAAAAALDAFCDNALREVKPPDFKQDLSTVKDYTHWATAMVARLRSERDALIAQHLSRPEDMALLTRTESYARTERLLEVDLLAKISETAGDDILGLLSGDPRLESVLTRFRQLKRDLIQAADERDGLQTRLKEAEKRDRALLGVLGALLGEGAPAAAPGAGGARLSRVLIARRQALRDRNGLTDTERALLEADIARFRLANRLLTASRLGSDQSDAIALLERTVAGLPRQADGPSPGSAGRTWEAPAIVLLPLCCAALGAMVAFQARRIAKLRATTIGGTDAGRRAA
jgi:hypothetical protein